MILRIYCIIIYLAFPCEIANYDFNETCSLHKRDEFKKIFISCDQSDLKRSEITRYVLNFFLYFSETIRDQKMLHTKVLQQN